MSLTSFTNFVFFYLTVRLLVDGMEEFLVQPTAWYYVRYLGQSNLFLGFLLAAFPFGAVTFAPFVGALDVRFKAPKLILLMCSITKLIGNVLYTIPLNEYLPLVGRFMSGIGEGTVGVVYGAVTQGTSSNNRAQAFLYFEGLFSVGTAFGPMVGSFLTFKFDIFSLQINAGNSPGLILAIIWFLMLILTLFLPNDLTGKKSNVLESTDTSNDENGSESESTAINDNTEYSISRICCLYFVIFQSWITISIGLFYTPLLAVHHIGLGLAEIKLIYVNTALFAFLLFVTNYILSGYLSEKSFIAIGITSHIIPLLILFYLAFSWNDPQSANNSYFLFIFMIFLSVSFVIFPLAMSLLSKETPVNKASLYQSIAFSVLHVSNVISRVVAGGTFNKRGMIFVGVGLAIGWFVELTWILIEYRNLYPASKRKR